MSRSGLGRQPLHGGSTTRREKRSEVRLSEGDASPSPGRRRPNTDAAKLSRGKPSGQDESENLDTSRDSQFSDLSGDESAGPSPVASRTRSRDSVERDLARQRAAKAGSKPRSKRDGLVSATQTKSEPLLAKTHQKASVKVTASQNKDSSPSPTVLLYSLIASIIITLVVLSMLPKEASKLEASPAVDSRLGPYKEHVQHMKTMFPSQNKRTWQVVGAMGRALLRPSDIITQPAVLLVASVPGAHDTANCLALHVAHGFDQKPTVVYGEKLRHLNADEAKKHLDEVLHAGFSQGGRAAVVYSLQDIPIQANLIFHSYCDNTNAPYKETAIILVLQLEKPISTDRTNPEIEGEVLERLQDHLQRDGALDVDKAGALLSRMAGFVLLVDKSDNLPTSCSL